MRRTLAVIATAVALTAGGGATAALAGQPVTAASHITVAASSNTPNTGGTTTVTKKTSDKTGLWGLLGLLGLGGLAKRRVKADDNYDTTAQRR